MSSAPPAGNSENAEGSRTRSSAFETLVADLETDLGDELHVDAEAEPGRSNGVDANAVEAEVARVLGIPVVEAETVGESSPGADAAAGPSPPLGAEAEADASPSGGGGGEGDASQAGSIPAATIGGLEVEAASPSIEGEGGEGDVIRAESIPTVTICGRTLRRSTAVFVGALAVVVAIVVPLAAKFSADHRRRRAWEQRRLNLVEILSPLSRGGVFDAGGLNASADRIDALEWMAGDFPEDASTVTEMRDHYPEWKMRQRYVLALLYFSTGGPGWYTQLEFLSDADECLWAGNIPRFQGNKNVMYNEDGHEVDKTKLNVFNSGGVTCREDGRVDTITLAINNLVGTIPDEISDLRESLTKFGVMRNTISSFIPESLGELKNLRVLNLRENCLTGYIPDGLSELSMLSLARFQGNNDLRGNLNAFCNGTRYREGKFGIDKIQAECGDCLGSTALVECECCECCDFNKIRCCDKAGKESKKKAYAFETFNRGECSLNDVQRKWRDEYCPCFVTQKVKFVNRTVCSEYCPPI